MNLLLIWLSTLAWGAQPQTAAKPAAAPLTETAHEESAFVPHTWHFGVALGLQAQMQDVAEIEAGSKEYSWGQHRFSLVAAYKGGDTVLQDVNNEHYTNHIYKLMLEDNHYFSGDQIKSFVRLGVGYTDTEKIFHPKGHFIMMPFELGFQFKLLEQEDLKRLYGFVEVASDINFLGNNTPAKDFDGTALLLGLRGYY